MKKIDAILNNITMYRLVVYVLGGYIGFGIILAFLGKLSFSPTAMVVSLAILAASAYLADRGFARIWRMPSNTESWLITTLILFLVVQPADSISTGLYLALAGAVSSISKYVLSWRGKHIFNPAAFAAALLSLTALQPSTWWIGSSVFWPVTLVGGVALVRKIRRGPLFMTFGITTILLQFALFVAHNQPLAAGMKGMLLASPFIFLATVMLTEPATMPPRRGQQMLFAFGVAVLYVTGWKVGPVYIYPEVALLLGNIYAFIVSPKFRVRLRLEAVQRISDQVYNYVFKPDMPFSYIPGQYMEWTLPGVPYDNRGNRRTFTIASSPTEQQIYLGVKFYDPASAFKMTLANMNPGDSIYASQLAGSFTLNAGQGKLAFIAGGIGITPFRSMVKYLCDAGIERDVVLLYLVSRADELAYHEDFVAAREYGITYIPIVTDAEAATGDVLHAKLSPQLIERLVPDYAERTFYVSGPNRMVDGTKEYLKTLRMPATRVHTDHFSGY